MARVVRCFFPHPFLFALVLGLGGCATPPPADSSPHVAQSVALPPQVAESSPHPVMLGIDVLEADDFAAVKGKRIALLTHPAGVNRRGEQTIEVLRRAPGVKLVKLFSPEHGLYGVEKAGDDVADTIDRRTGLPVFSLHGQNRKPTAEHLKDLDALVIDLQDIGVRSYTFNVVMRYAMDSCFRHSVEVIVLDRPNPLGGLKVDGPSLDREWRSGVGAFPMPYIHGLTMGELARFAADTPGVLEDVSDEMRVRGKLRVIPMRGWNRAMRWPETGLTFVPTSRYIRNYDAVLGYAMVGLGCEYSGFRHGLGTPFPFRLLSFQGRISKQSKSFAQLEADLKALSLPGVGFRQLTTHDDRGRPVSGVAVEVTHCEQWNPTELSFHLLRLACRYDPPNPFLRLKTEEMQLFNKHVGSTAWWEALRRDGARVDVETWLRMWQVEARAYQEQTRKYWLYR